MNGSTFKSIINITNFPTTYYKWVSDYAVTSNKYAFMNIRKDQIHTVIASFIFDIDGNARETLFFSVHLSKGSGL